MSTWRTWFFARNLRTNFHNSVIASRLHLQGLCTNTYSLTARLDGVTAHATGNVDNMGEPEIYGTLGHYGK